MPKSLRARPLSLLQPLGPLSQLQLSRASDSASPPPEQCPRASLQHSTHPATAWGKRSQLPEFCFPERQCPVAEWTQDPWPYTSGNKWGCYTLEGDSGPKPLSLSCSDPVVVCYAVAGSDQEVQQPQTEETFKAWLTSPR